MKPQPSIAVSDPTGPCQITGLSDIPATSLATLMNEAFADYLAGAAHMDAAAFLAFCAAGGVDTERGFLALADNRPAGVVLVGRQGALWRVATMGIIPSFRRRGLGRQLLTRVLGDAHRKGCLELQLEVFEQNTGALALYRELGFSPKRRLNGWTLAGPSRVAAVPIACEPCSAEEARRTGSLLDYPSLPWQNSPLGASLLSTAPDHFKGAGMAVAVAGLGTDTPVLRSVFLEDTRQALDLSLLLHALRAKYPDKRWTAPAFWPEEFDPAFEQAGFARSPLNQLQMRLGIGQP